MKSAKPKSERPRVTRSDAGSERRGAAVEPHARGRSDDGNAFIRDPSDGGPARTSDDLAENMAEDFVQAATSGEDASEDVLNEMVPEELGGPFIETSGEEEFAAGTDPSNPPDAEPEPLPRPNHGIVGIPEE
jgi:hypothetical protein